ncbi:MAG: DUF937 domain-containing protein, partial [Alphaproteobacteria bacterium]|nr:DUF937 domain-containing protein [Alphaproteobacteria bacterium]
AAGALILAKWLGGSRSDKPAEPSSSGQGQSRSAPQGRPRSPADIMPPDLPQQTQRMPSPAPMPGQRGGQQGLPQHRGQGRGEPQTIDINIPDEGVSGGLGGLLEKLRNGGLGEEADSWVKTGPNKPVDGERLRPAIGDLTVSEIARRAGTSEQDIMEILTQVLPQLVDNMTPEGRVPTQQEIDRWGRQV